MTVNQRGNGGGGCGYGEGVVRWEVMGWEREGRFPGPKVTSCNFLYRLCNEGDLGRRRKDGRESFNFQPS